jgi:hypothetical protein
MIDVWKREGDRWTYKDYILQKAISRMGREEFRLNHGDKLLHIYGSLPSAKRAAIQHQAKDAAPRDMSLKLRRGNANDNQKNDSAN